MERVNGATGEVDGDQEVSVDRRRAELPAEVGWCPWQWWSPPDALAPVVVELLAWVRGRYRGVGRRDMPPTTPDHS